MACRISKPRRSRWIWCRCWLSWERLRSILSKPYWSDVFVRRLRRGYANALWWNEGWGKAAWVSLGRNTRARATETNRELVRLTRSSIQPHGLKTNPRTAYAVRLCTASGARVQHDAEWALRMRSCMKATTGCCRYQPSWMLRSRPRSAESRLADHCTHSPYLDYLY